MTIQGKPACTRDCESKTRVQEEKKIKKGKQTNCEKIYSCKTLLGKHTPIPNSEREKSEQFKHIECRKTPEEKQLGTSPVWSPILLRRKLPMAWGTTTYRVTIEINPFPYAREIKHLTLKNLETYLILDG